VNLKDIGKFEKNNPEIAVNLLGYPNQNIFPLRIFELNRKTVVMKCFCTTCEALYTTVRMAHQAAGFCRSGRIDFLLAQKYELLQTNGHLLGCERVMETRQSFILAGFTLSLPRSAPCGTEQTMIDTGCDPALLHNCADYPADCNLSTTITLLILH